MIRSIVLSAVASLSLLPLAASASGDGKAVSSSTPRVSTLTLDSFSFIGRATTLPELKVKLGPPEADVGRGIHIWLYRLADGSEILIGSIDGSRVSYVKHGKNVLFKQEEALNATENRLASLGTQAGELRDGDIIFQRSSSRQSEAIIAATGSEMTHVGVIFLEQGRPYVYEAVQPVCRTPLKLWISRGDAGKYTVKRLKDLSTLDTGKLKAAVLKMMGKDYDWLFEWSDDRIYCSELVWKGYERASGLKLGELRKLKDFKLGSPVVQKLMQERYGNNIPLDMDVIAPSNIFDSALLTTVETK